jgi:CRISPR-associated protein Csm5
MKRYKIKATALSPIHIGTGEAYEPTSYVINKEKEKYYLYYFKEENFFKSLSKIDKTNFLNLINNDSQESIFNLYKFISLRKNIIKNCYFYKVLTTSSLAEEYYKKLGKPTQVSIKKGIKEYNQFQINKSLRNLNSKKLYIPGSSIKGAINTALSENLFWYDKENKNFHKELIISDLIPKTSYEIIGYSLNKERFEKELIGPKNYIETIFSNIDNKSVFEFDITLKKFDDLNRHLNIKDIINFSNKHYKPLFDDMFKEKEINRVLDKKFKETYNKLTLKENQFLLKIGKHSGAKAVTIEEKRKILVKIAQIQNKRNEKDFNGNIRVKRMYRKSENENEKLEELMIDFNKLNDKEKRVMKDFEIFYFEPEKLEKLVRKKQKLSINAILKEETTSWLFGNKNYLKENSHLPFGWLLCEIVEEKEIL